MVRPKLISPDQSLPIRLLLGLYEAAASLSLAVVLIVISSIVLAWATLVESNLGTDAVRFGFYGTWWFSFLVLLLGLNVLCAALIRFPWKKYQTGFLLTHAGILILLIGCLQTRLSGIEAKLSIYEGHAYHLASQDTQHFEIEVNGDGKRQTIRVPFSPGPFNWSDYSNDLIRMPSRKPGTLYWFPWKLARRDRGVLYDQDGIRLEVFDYYSDSTISPPPLLLRAKGKTVDLDAKDNTPSQKAKWTTVELDVNRMSNPHTGHGMFNLSSLEELPGGERFAYWTAQSSQETKAFRLSRTEGPLGELGQLVLFAKNKKHVVSVDRLQEKGRIPLGASGIEIELVRHSPQFLFVELSVYHDAEEKPSTMRLWADLPHLNQQDQKHALFGTYWFDASKWTFTEADAAKVTKEAASMIPNPDRPRIDILQGTDGKLYFRTWKSPATGDFDVLPVDGSKMIAFAGTDFPVTFFVDSFTPDDTIGGIIQPVRYHPQKKDFYKTRRARVQLSVDDRTEEFWLKGISSNPARSSVSGSQRLVSSSDRNATVTLNWDRLNVGFDIYLHEFRRILDPGTNRASHYWSVVDFRELSADEPDTMLHEKTPDRPGHENESNPKILEEKVLVIMNHPVDFSDPTTGRSYRIFQESYAGPWKPGSSNFDKIADNSFPRDQLYSSTLTVNYDPGRGLKYLGSLLIALGIATVFYMKAYFFRPRGKIFKPTAKGALLLAFGLSMLSGTAHAGQPKIDWTPWECLPTFYEGRMMPVTTFARSVVDDISGRTNPKLSLDGAELSGGTKPPGWSKTEAIFSEGGSRKFTADELLFRWIANTKRWENVPFLEAEHEQLREEVLDLPIHSLQGKRLKYVSPAQVENSTRFRNRISEVLIKLDKAMNEDRPPDLSEVEVKAKDLYEAFALYRRLTFDPTDNDARRNEFMSMLVESAQMWPNVAPELERILQSDPTSPLAEWHQNISDSLQQLSESAGGESIVLETVEPQVFALVVSSRKLAEQLQRQRQQLLADPPSELSESKLKNLQNTRRSLAVHAADMARLANEAHLALYDNGHTMQLVPSLNPAALEKGRDTSDTAKPWLSLQTVRFGSPEVLKGYPPEMVADVRKAFDDAAAILSEKKSSEQKSSEQAERFNKALHRFAESTRRLGESIEPVRISLPLREVDKRLIQVTAYPPVGATATELHYHRLNPFFWAWVTTFLAMLMLAVAFGLIRKPMFWAGLITLAVAQGFITYGLSLRVVITGWAPVTNMFETVVFVALVVGVLGIWFALLPLIWPGLSTAWRMTAVPGTPEATPLSSEARSLGYTDPFWKTASIVLSAARLVLAVCIGYLLTMVAYGSGNGSTVIALWPRTDVGSSLPSAGNILVWAVGVVTLLVTVWFVPRILLAFGVSILTIPATLLRQGLSKPMSLALARKQVVLAAAGVGLLAAVVAHKTSLSKQEIGLLMPVLRDNVWLTLHVLTITASYGAGGLAWGLGLIALGYYLFGRYRDPDILLPETLTAVHRPAAGVTPQPVRRSPETCAELSHYMYKSIQVAVLFLVIGTVLGGLWADVAWGRFWGWDSKEVWSLISLLIYLAVLHGRYAGFFGNFGLTVGAIMGVSSILMAWYGVNYWLGSGQHTYGGDAGGFKYAVLLVLVSWIFVGFAAMRYSIERSAPQPARE